MSCFCSLLAMRIRQELQAQQTDAGAPGLARRTAPLPAEAWTPRKEAGSRERHTCCSAPGHRSWAGAEPPQAESRGTTASPGTDQHGALWPRWCCRRGRDPGCGPLQLGWYGAPAAFSRWAPPPAPAARSLACPWWAFHTAQLDTEPLHPGRLCLAPPDCDRLPPSSSAHARCPRPLRPARLCHLAN